MPSNVLPNLPANKAMSAVLGALAPGVAVLVWLYGLGVLVQIFLAAASMLAVEYTSRRTQPVLGDGSSLVSATLLAIAIPASTPWWVTLSVSALACYLGKVVFGGNGKNLFNVAMLGYVIALLGFGAHLSLWPAPFTYEGLGLFANPVDGISQATLLDALKTNDRFISDELFARFNGYGLIAARSDELKSLAFLAGGLWLIKKRIIAWQTPCAVLLGLFVTSLVFYNGAGSNSHGSPMLHLFSGASILCAFFIATEPVTGAKSAKGRWYLGFALGALIYLLRTFSPYPDGVAFAVLLANALVLPLERWIAEQVPHAD